MSHALMDPHHVTISDERLFAGEDLFTIRVLSEAEVEQLRRRKVDVLRGHGVSL